MDNGNSKRPELSEYERKRDFSRTPEPPGGAEETRGGIFVIQKHAARTLHYDLRLEFEGVLKSWAVPKGPPVAPGEKHLAVRVEDHPIEYASFEGIIPKGEYGAGTVMIWDNGHWSPEEDPGEGLNKGALKFVLDGQKLKGRWALVQLKKKEEERDEKDEWLLIKERDNIVPGRRLEEMSESVVSGRGMEEIAAFPKDIWLSQSEISLRLHDLSGVEGAEEAPFPERLFPQLATLVTATPTGSEWIHEIKYDGYRVLARVDEGRVALITRGGNDWTSKFPSIAGELEKIPVRQAWLDGEIAFLKEDGTTSFEGIQQMMSDETDRGLKYFLFDIVYLNGYSLMEAQLRERKALLKSVLSSPVLNRAVIMYSDHIEGMGEDVYAKACSMGLEGIISKRADSLYRQGRTEAWLKTKCHKRGEFVVGGFTEAKGARKGFGALLIGFYDNGGRFIYSGRVGTGFNEKTVDDIWNRVSKIEEPSPYFSNPPTGADARGVRWVRPEIVIEVEYAERTMDGVLRHPSFQGIREDKPPLEVKMEEPRSTEEAKQAAGVAIAATHAISFYGVKLTKPGQVLYPDKGLSKRDVAEYYIMAAQLMLPHIKDRPLTLVRCPEGYDKECFFQKHTAYEKSLPAGIHKIEVPEKDEVETYMMVDSVEGILGLVQMGTLEIHTWGSRSKRLEYPDRLTFDIDPDTELEWERVIEAALLLKGVFMELGLASFIKTTGGKGLHVVVPVEPVCGWEEARAFTKGVADYIAAGLPDRFVSTMTRSKRAGRIFIDYVRNVRGSTAIEAYSTRARKGAPLSVPVSWDELKGGVRSDYYTLENIRDRLKAGTDPWKGYFELKQSITEDMKKLVGVR